MNTTTTVWGHTGELLRTEVYRIEVTGRESELELVVEQAQTLCGVVETVEAEPLGDVRSQVSGSGLIRQSTPSRRIVLKVRFIQAQPYEVETYLALVRGLRGAITKLEESS